MNVKYTMVIPASVRLRWTITLQMIPEFSMLLAMV